MEEAMNVQVVARAESHLLLAVEETAQRLGIGKTLVWELVWNGVLPSVRLGRCVRVPLRALEEWIAHEAGDGR